MNPVLPLVDGPVPPWMVRSRTVLDPGAELVHDPRRWAGALVIVEAGAIELEGHAGARARLDRGAMFWLAGLSLRAVHNPGEEAATLVAVARRGARGYGADG